MKEAIYARLFAAAPIRALVDERITPGRRTQGDPLPSVTFNTISAPRRRTLRGRTAMVQGRMQIDCWGATEDSADTLAKAVKAELEGARFEHGGVRVRGVFLIDEADDEGSGDPETPFRTRLDFRVSHIPA